MECRKGCGVCCIILSISSPIPGMPDGKPAGVKCIHLTPDFKCGIFDSVDRPKVCGQFKAEKLFCGDSRDEALKILSRLEGLDTIKNR
jgi:uncharacterized protein